MDKGCGSGLAVRTGNADGLSVKISRGKFQFTDDGDLTFHKGLHHGGRLGNSRTFHTLVGIDNAFHGVLSLLPRQLVGIEHGLVGILDVPGIGHEDFIAFLLRQNGCPDSALAGAEDYDFLFLHSS